MSQYNRWKYTKEYREQKIRRITLDVQQTTYETWKRYADENGTPLATLIKTAVNLYTQNDLGDIDK